MDDLSSAAELCLLAPAKLNLSLDVLYKREDGYHALSTVMAQTQLCDCIRMRPAPEVRVEADVPLPADNTAFRAARLFCAQYGCGGAHIYIEKRIPSEAGLGGASADAAAVLRGMQRLYGAPADEAALRALAKRVGADVPFCLHGGLALCEGIGEIISPLPPLRAAALIVKGTRGVSTAALFQSLRLPVEHPDTEGLLRALRAGDLADAASRMENALERPASALVPEIAVYKARLLEAGALGASMSGSGAAVFGLFESEAAARTALPAFRDLPFACWSMIC